jgi:transcriptional regulator with XRE-family HTH domain
MSKLTVPFEDVLARFSPEQRAEIERRAAELIAEELTLQELRKAQALTQQKMARALGISQESVSNIETRADMLISTLRGYVKAMGGELSLRVSFPNRPPVELRSLAAGRAKRRGAKRTATAAAAPRKRRTARR